jgi:hypothetical protein
MANAFYTIAWAVKSLNILKTRSKIRFWILSAIAIGNGVHA